MPSNSTSVGEGLTREVLPLVKDGFVILRSILDVMIDRIEEAEKGREDGLRLDIYSSIIDALEAEIENLEKEDDDASRSKVEALETVISVLMKESKEMVAAARQKNKQSRRPRKVNID